MNVPPVIFDRKTMRRRHAQAKPEAAAFLYEALGSELAARASLILRRFDRTLLCGPFLIPLPGQFGETVTRDNIAFDDEALPFASASFDCIVSLLSMQSLNDLPGALVQARRVLKPDGLFLGCLFVGKTLIELRRAWLEAETDMRGGVTPRVAPMIDLSDLTALLQRAGFALPVTDLDRTTVRYSSALGLMREIKALGFSNALADRSRKPVTPKLLAAAAASYERHFSDPDGKVRASIEIAWATAWTPHESQPKPLKPGSAKARLADALGVREIKTEN